MLQSVWTDQGLAVSDVPPPPLPAGWVRLRVAACGICGSDLHRYRAVGRRPAGGVPGHELCGTIMEAGHTLPDVLYAAAPWSTCGQCDFCQAGQSQLCRAGQLLGVHIAGGLAHFIDVPEQSIYPVDLTLTPLEASLTEPVAVCLRAVHLARLKFDSRVLVLGGGTLGLISGLLAHDIAPRVGVTTRYPHQTAAALRLGLEPVAEAELTAWAKDVEPDVVIETVGGEADTMNQAMQACRGGGRIVVLGLFSEFVPFDGRTLVQKELSITGSRVFGQSDHGPEFCAATEVLPRHRDAISVIQTHQFPLARIEDAFACAADKHTGSIKVTVLTQE
jgi:threonine dehydrogenase-like Zn-dependent dehydrogenase